MSKIDDLTYSQLNSSNTIYASLNNLLKNGIEIDKNLRQPTYYSRINLDELKIEIFAIINNFLINQKVPLWLCQRISWFYSNKYMNEIVKHFKELDNDDNQELKFIKREKLVDFIKNHISKIIAEWFTEKANQNDPKNMLFSFSRFEAKHLKTILHYSEFGLKNKRRIMEDKTAIFENIDLFCNNKEISFKKRSNSLFGVFDGHCGADCSQYISTHLPMHLIQHEDFFNSNNNKDMSKLLKESFQIINERFTEKAKLESLKSGSTCCLALLNSLESNNNNNNNINNDNKTSQMRSIDVAWCGDTQFCLIRNGQIYFITDEHKPNQPSELKRIEESGSTVTFTSEAWRINGSLAVSRSFGDVNYQPSVIAEPDVKHIDLDDAFDYFIIGCDGLWETFNKNDLLEFVYEHRNDVNVNMAELLVRKALENGSTDNITAIFVLLKDDLSQIEKPIIL